jgi:hypothetical protein
MSKLYNLPRNSKFRIIDPNITIPPDSPNVDYETVYKLHNLDGMYSYCTRDSIDELDKTPVHIAAWTDVELLDKT